MSERDVVDRLNAVYFDRDRRYEHYWALPSWTVDHLKRLCRAEGLQGTAKLYGLSITIDDNIAEPELRRTMDRIPISSIISIPDDMKQKAKQLHDHPGFLIAGRESNSQEFVVLSRAYFNEVMQLLKEVGE